MSTNNLYYQKKKGSVKVRNNKIFKFTSLALVVAVCGLMTFPAHAKWRRMMAADICQENSYWSATGYLDGMIMDSNDTYRYIYCPLPSDSYFSHTEIEQINIHVYHAIHNMMARGCRQDYNSASTSCSSNWGGSSTNGEATITLTGISLDKITQYSTWGPFVQVTANYDGNIVRFIYTTD